MIIFVIFLSLATCYNVDDIKAPWEDPLFCNRNKGSLIYNPDLILEDIYCDEFDDYKKENLDEIKLSVVHLWVNESYGNCLNFANDIFEKYDQDILVFVSLNPNSKQCLEIIYEFDKIDWSIINNIKETMFDYLNQSEYDFALLESMGLLKIEPFENEFSLNIGGTIIILTLLLDQIYSVALVTI